MKYRYCCLTLILIYTILFISSCLDISDNDNKKKEVTISPSPSQVAEKTDNSEATLSIYTDEERKELRSFEKRLKDKRQKEVDNYNIQIEKLNEQVNNNQNSADILYKRGKFLYDNNYYKEAIADFTSVLNLDINYIEAIHYRGLSYYKTNKIEKAKKEAEKAISLDKDYVKSHILLGNCYLDSGYINRAIQEYEIVKKLSKGNNDILFYYYINMSDIYRKKGDMQKAISLCKSSIETYVDPSKSYEFLAILNLESENYEDAKKAIDKAIEREPFRVGSYFYEGKYHIFKKNYKKALLCFDKALLIAPSEFAFHINKIAILTFIRKPHNALDAINEAMKIDSNEPTLFYYRGIANGELGNMQDAVNDLKTCIRISHKNKKNKLMKLAKTELEKIKGQKSSLRNSPTPPLPSINTAFALFSSEEMNKLAEEYFSLLKQEKYKEITDLFHYPTEDTPKETIKDREMLIEFHRLMKREFGTVKKHTLFTMGTYFYNTVGIYTGKASYWQRNPLFKQLIYNVDFNKEGSGRIIFHFCNINNKLEMRMVQYGLPQSNKGSKEKADRILKELEKIKKSLDNEKMRK